MRRRRLQRAIRQIGRTQGRPAYARCIGMGSLRGINYESGFLIGWDRWSDGRYDLSLIDPRLLL